MSTLFLRHIRRHLLARVTTAAGPGLSGSLILIGGPEGAKRSTALDALAAPLSHRPQVRLPLFPWHRTQPGAVRELLPPLEEDAVLLIDDLHHADEQSLEFLVSRVRRPGSTLTVLATVDGPDLDPLASRVIHLPPLTLPESAAYLRSIAGERVPADTVEAVHVMSGGWPGFIDEVVAAAPGGHLAVPGAPVPVPEPWRIRWAGICDLLDSATVDALHRGELDRAPEAVARGVLHGVPTARGRRWLFRDPRDAAVAASRNPGQPTPDSPVEEYGSVAYERRQLAKALAGAARLDLPVADLYLGECRGRVEPEKQDNLRGYLALYAGRPHGAHAYLDEPGPEPEQAVRGVLLSLADWDPVGMQRKVAAIRRGGDPDSAAVMEARIVGLVADAALSGRMPAIDLAPTNSLNGQRLGMVHGWLSLAFDDPLTAREKLQPLPGRSPVIGLWQDAWLARTLYVLGEWSEAALVVERGLASAEVHGIQLLEPLLLWTGAQITAMQGDAALSQNYLHRLTLGEDAFLIQKLPSAMGKMIVSASNSDLPTALRAGEQLAGIVTGTDTQHPGFWPWEDVYAQTLIRAGRIDRADEVISSAEERHTPSGLISLTAKNAVPRATIQLQRGQLSAGLRTFQDAVDAISSVPMPAYQARILFEYGKVLRRHGRRSKADDILSRAAEVFARMGATAMVERCAAERRIGGVGGHHRGRHGLTPQEEQIALRVVEGATNGEVARELTLSTKTVEYHLTRVYRKLEVRSRQELRELLNAG